MGLARLLIAVSVLFASGASAPPERTEDASQLVRQLGSPSFSAREKATHRLAALGMAAEAPLAVAARDPDAELRRRAGKLLAQVREQDFLLRLESFAADAGGRRDYRIPFWRGYSKLLGDTRAARDLFVEMQRAEPELLEALDTGGKTTGVMFSERCLMLVQAMESEVPAEVPLGTVASMLLVSGSPQVSVDDQVTIQVYRFILQMSFQSSLRDEKIAPLLKKLLGAWIRRNNGSSFALQNLMLAFSLNLEEGLQVSLDILRDAPQQQGFLQHALLGIGKYGDRKHLTLVEPHLKNIARCDAREVKGQQLQAQIRDVALAVSVHLTGQPLADYGFSVETLTDQALFHPGMLGFATEAKRKAGFDKWATWKAAHP